MLKINKLYDTTGKKTVPHTVLCILIVILLILPNILCGQTKVKTVPANDTHITYMGRVDRQNDTISILYWSGTSVSLNFIGTSVSVKLEDETGQNFFYAIIDNQKPVKKHFDKAKASYILADNLPNKKHTVQLFKLTEGKMGKTTFYGFELPETCKLLPANKPNKHKIEFYGNSITSGYSLEDTIGDSGEAKYYNNYYSYAALTARHFNADYYCISKSGIGLMLSWFPVIMPEMYTRLDPEDPFSKWDFSNYTPDVVVVNLLQNDSWLINKPEHAQFKARFGTKKPAESEIISAYKSFISNLRNKYPKATIICALGSMDATKVGLPWTNYITKAVQDLHDTKILTHFFPYKNTPGHPKKREQEAMGNSLIKFINKNVKW